MYRRHGHAVLVVLGPLAMPVSAAGQSAPSPTVYEYVYPYNTDDLNENHFIVLDSVGSRVRGWYYGTSDEFDSAREGYLPGFFVAEMRDLALGGGAMAFSLVRPESFFTSPVPREYRSAGEIPAGLLEPWTVPVVETSRVYEGTLGEGQITLRSGRVERTFRPVPR